MKNEYQWHLLDDCFPKAFPFLAALWGFISNEGVFIVVMLKPLQKPRLPSPFTLKMGTSSDCSNLTCANVLIVMKKNKSVLGIDDLISLFSRY